MGSPLNNISPLDGRYSKYLEKLSPFFSEASLIKYRVLIEIEYLIALSNEEKILELKPLSKTECSKLRKIVKSFNEEDAKRVKAIEIATNHDVKAVEYFLREKLKKINKKKLFPWIHFALTSEDINNLSFSLMWKESISDVYIKDLKNLYKKLKSLSKQYSKTSILSLTHGQPATPSTFGKELAVFTFRIKRQLDQLESQKFLGKFGGATGTWAAHNVAYPDINWVEFSKKFIKSIGLIPNVLTTQIESHDTLVESYHNIIRINNISIDLCRDIWMYISRGILSQKKVPGEIGSSTMPHKINPIQFENAEGNFGLSNSLLEHLANKLPISRMQRDLTDSTTLRNQGIALGYSYLAIQSVQKGLNRITVNKKNMCSELDQHWEVLTEAIQTILRKFGSTDAYEQLKEMSQGSEISNDDIKKFVTLLRIPMLDKKRLLELTPADYTGISSKLVDLI